MTDSPLPLILVLLAASVFVVTLARRLGLPSILGYVTVGLVLGPHAIGVFPESEATHLLAELGVVFLLFTLGLEFSWPRMVALRREVFGLGSLQVFGTAAAVALIAHAFGIPWAQSIVLGGVVAMSSTVLILQLLTERAELNRTHGRLAFSVVLFQDIAVVPFLALAAALDPAGEEFTIGGALSLVGAGTLAVLVVLAAGRWLLRPLLYVIANSRLRELFTLAVLLVALASAWASQLAGLSMALGAFLAGMMLAETEYSHQVESVIRPFRDILLGLFFISVGMLLDVRALWDELALILALLVSMVILKAVIAGAATRLFVDNNFRAIRTGVTLAVGGEFGIALLTLLLQHDAIDPEIAQPMLVAVVLGMVLAPVIISNNKRIARLLLGERGPPKTAIEREDVVTQAVARREHVILCGFGRVGQNVARVLEAQGFEYIAIDLDPVRVRHARQMGQPVVYGDSADEQVLEEVGLAKANAVVISFSDNRTSLAILRSLRRLRSDVPVLVRTPDDSRLHELKAAGATEVVPEAFEASLMLASHVLMSLKVPPTSVMRSIAELRGNRYEMLRAVIARGDHSENDAAFSEEVRSVVVPPGSWCIGKRVDEVRAAGAQVAITGIRRHGILGREPSGETEFQDGDIVVIYGTPEALEHAEAVMLAG
ncbi:MAG TPA: monovalent cation:proton antiporter-2 (CPA2) family protein [Steroidobacteraceae bacterium]|nr:monovalent cation:proton antiporter-2 (CPA2) family protein [Steroidobacteraceae bacterium]